MRATLRLREFIELSRLELVLFAGPYTSAIGITVYGPANNEKGTHSAHQMLRAK